MAFHKPIGDVRYVCYIHYFYSLWWRLCFNMTPNAHSSPHKKIISEFDMGQWKLLKPQFKHSVYGKYVNMNINFP